MQSEARIAELGTSATGLDVTALLVVHGDDSVKWRCPPSETTASRPAQGEEFGD